MASFEMLKPLRDYNANIVDGCYNIDGKQRFCCAATNGDAFAITRPPKYEVMGLITTCGDLWCSFTDPLTGPPAAPPALPTTLTNLQGNRFLIPDREHIVWYYVPSDVETISFYAGRAGSFCAVFLTAPLQMQDDV